MKNIFLFFAALFLSIGSYAQVPAAITGSTTTCIGVATPYADVTTGGSWSVSDVTVATIGMATGVLEGVTAGTVVVTYTVPPSSYATLTVTVLPAPCPGPGMSPHSVCAGSGVTVTGCVSGGTWSSSAPAILSVDSAAGFVYGNTVGTSTLTYTLAPGCLVTATFTVNATPPPITGASSVCAGSNITEADIAPGGVWSSSSPAIATVGATGIVGGVSSGATMITYVLSDGCFADKSITVGGSVVANTVTGGGAYCAGGAGLVVGVDGSQVGVNYQLFKSGIAVGSPVAGTGAPLNFGLMTAAGVYTVVGTNSASGCSANMTGSVTITVSPLPAVFSISGGGSYCAGGSGATIILSGSVTGVSYQLIIAGSPFGAALPGTGSSLSFGPVTGAGIYTIVASDDATGCLSAMSGSVTIAVNPLPTAYTVVGGGTYCTGGVGVHVNLSNSDPGINYQLYNGLATVGASLAGTGAGLDFGLEVAAGSYTVVATDASTGCTNTMTGSVAVTVLPTVAPGVSITASPSGTVCPGTSVTFTAVAVNGGAAPTYAWTVDGSAVGSSSTYTYVPANGDVVGVTMTSSATCPSPASASTTMTMSVASPTITASASSVGCDGSYTLTAGGGATYSWAPTGGLSCPTCSSTSINPTATTTFTVTGTDGSGCSNTATVSVDGNRIKGTVSPSGGTIRVWLIQFNAADSSIVAIDSTTACASGGSSYYEFDDAASGNYLVKAYLLGGTPGTSGYIPTYGSSSAVWSSGTSVAHASATDNLAISMILGTVPSGPGFIGGFISSGAGKGTAGTVPVEGMLVYLMDASYNVLTYVYTDASGNYAFNGIANGSYIIYPEDYQYTTTPAPVTLSSASESVSGIDFKQRTAFRTIVPASVTRVSPIAATGTGINVFPNPATDNLNIQWQNQTIGTADVVITDVVGREVLRSAININAATGQTQLGLQSVKDGVYMITVKNGNINYSGKLAVTR